MAGEEILPPPGFLTWGEADAYALAALGMSGPPEHADRSGQACSDHPSEETPKPMPPQTCTHCGERGKTLVGREWRCWEHLG